MSEAMCFGKIQRRILAVLSAFFFFLTAGSSVRAEQYKVSVVMIHNNPCESCREPDKLLDLLSELAPKAGFGSEYEGRVYYAYRDEGNELVQQAVSYFELEKSEIVYPLVFVGDQYLMGYSQMEQELTSYMSQAGENNMTEVVWMEQMDAVEESSSAQNTEDTENFVIQWLKEWLFPKLENYLFTIDK